MFEIVDEFRVVDINFDNDNGSGLDGILIRPSRPVTIIFVIVL